MSMKIFQRFYDIARDRAGISLKPGKEAMLVARLNRRIKALELGGMEEYLEYLENDHEGEELVHFLDSVSTNFTSFFRESDHFEKLEMVVKLALERNRRRLRFWSAASSSGEEPYTMAMTIAEAIETSGLDPVGVDWKILATDISTVVLNRALAGVYPAKTVETVPTLFRNKYFRRSRDARGENAFEIVAELKRRVVFKRMNLATPPYPMTGPLDLVFCRNVMIYFDADVKKGITTEVERLLAPGGLFLVGHSETIADLRTALKTLEPSVYYKPRAEEPPSSLHATHRTERRAQ